MIEKPSENIIFPKTKKVSIDGIIIITKNHFFRRLWFLISNPLRYLFTGKIYY